MFQDTEKISSHQAFTLALTSGLGDIFVVITVPAVTDAGRDGWIPVMLAYTISIFIALALVNLGHRFPNKTIVQYLPIVLGKPIGKILGLSYIFVMWAMASVVFREAEELVSFFFTNTPLVATGTLFAVLIIYTMKKGIEVFARVTEILIVVVIFFIVFSLSILLLDCNFKNILPVMENGVMPIINALPTHLSYGMETILFAALWLPCLNNNKPKKALVTGLSISGILLTLLVIICIAFTGTELTKELSYPLFYMFSYIQIGHFITGFAAIFMLIWVSSSYLELLVFFYPPVVGLAQWLNLKTYKPLIIPMFLITWWMSFIPSNLYENLNYDKIIGNYIKLPIGLSILLIWLIAVIRGLDESKIKT